MSLEGNVEYALTRVQSEYGARPDTNEWRSYSMASMPRDLPQLEFLVRLIDGGTMSEYLRAPNRVGEAITIEGPLGAFILHPSRAPHIFVAGGTNWRRV